MTEIITTVRQVDPSFPIPDGLEGYEYADRRTRTQQIASVTSEAINGINSQQSVDRANNALSNTVAFVPDTTNTFTIVSQVVNISNSGDQYVNVVASVDDVINIDRWEMRVSSV